MPSVGNTPRIFADTLMQLMSKKPFEKISVTAIVDCCGLNRNSFYYHFRDKYDLVNWIYKTEFVDIFDPSKYDSNWQIINDICQYFYENRSFYTKVLSVQGQNSFSEYFKEVTHVQLAPHHTEPNMNDGIRNFYAAALSDAFVAIILRWLCEGAKIPPQEFLGELRRTTIVAAESLKGVTS